MSSAAAISGPRPDASFAARLDATAAEIERLLDRLLSAAPQPGEVIRPPRLLEAMRNASLGGGKRLRPLKAAAHFVAVRRA